MAAYWKVNSYGYPNPFSEESSPATATATLDAFLSGKGYSALKQQFEAGSPRKLDHAAVESWKASFEEFGILFVPAGEDEIVLTPGGRQLLEARAAGDAREFARVGLGLLLRYPLRGQRDRRPELAGSDLLIHRAVLATMLELDGEVWWPEVAYVLSGALTRSKLTEAVAAVKAIRDGDEREILEHEPPVPLDDRNFYNMLNQVFNHCGMNGLLLERSKSSERFGDPDVPGFHFTASTRVERIRGSMRELVEAALGGGDALDCTGYAGSPLERLPAAPTFAGEEEYFAYAGAIVPAEGAAASGPVSKTFGGRQVWFLREGQDYEVDGEAIVGPQSKLCAIAPRQRLVLSHDLERTRLVDAKSLTGDGRVELKVHRARLIADRGKAEATLA